MSMAHHVLIRCFRLRWIFISVVVFYFIALLVFSFNPGVHNVLDPKRCFSAPTPEDYTNGEEQINTIEYKQLDDVLLANLSPVPGQSIFFHDTSCPNLNQHSVYSLEHLLELFAEPPARNVPRSVNVVQLTARQACAIESAALHNPKFNVFVLFTKPSYIDNTSDERSLINTLLTYPNVHLRNVNLWTYAAGTPMYDWIMEGTLFKSSYVLSHTSDFLRYLTLWRWGGLYLDMDTVTLRSMQDLPPNYTGAESNRSAAAGVMNFSPNGFGHDVATQCLHDFQKNFNGQKWGNNGPGVITRVLYQICRTKHVDLMIDDPNRCRGFKVFNKNAFYAIHWEKWEHFFDPNHMNSTLFQTRNSYVLHVWNNFSKRRIIEVGTKTAYGKLANEHCPKVYAATGKYF